MEYKGYDIVGDGTYGHKLIKAIGKGSVHLELRGSYTNSNFAQTAIDQFLANNPAKKGAVKDGESK